MQKKLILDDKIIEFKDFNNKWDYIKKCINKEFYSKKGGAMINNTIFTYDSETSNYIDKKGDKKPFVFSLMLTVVNPANLNTANILCRRVEEFKYVLNKITSYLGCVVHKTPMIDKKTGAPVFDINGEPRYDESHDKWIDIFIHNLPFDISFLLPKIDTYKVFSSDLHKPYYVVTSNGVRFKDTVVLTQKTLDQLGKGLQYFKVRKAVGDFDYDKIRTPETPFTKKEYGYVVDDTLVLAAYIREEMDNYSGKIVNIPLTQTGKVRDFVRKTMSGNVKKLKELDEAGILPYSLTKIVRKGKLTQKDLDTLKVAMGESGRNFQLTRETYDMMSRAYTGGFTHSNPNHTGKIMKNVQSWDFTSSYPTRILSEKFAMGNGGRVKITKNILEDDKENLYLFDVSFDKITAKTDYDFYLSSSKCEHSDEGFIESNGRVVNAEQVKTTMLSTDWEIFSKVYEMEGVKFGTCYKFKMGYLPLGIIMSTLYFYKQKTTLKGVKGREHDYMLFKEMLNSIYGMTVQDPIKDTILYSDASGWVKRRKKDFPESYYKRAINEYNQSMSRFLFYIWGVQISSYSRRDLWKGIMACGDDYVYSDTDSIKVINSEKHKKFVSDYNHEIVEKIKKCLKFYHINPALANPADIKGKYHMLGVWDPNDGFYSYFKTLGAKRYIDISKSDSSFEITIAGLSKSKGASYLLSKSKCEHNKNIVVNSNENIKKLFNFFDDELFVPASKTGKLAHYYIDHYDGFEVRDYKNNKCHIESGGGCLLKATDFTLSMSAEFTKFLQNISEGFSEDVNVIKNVL